MTRRVLGRIAASLVVLWVVATGTYGLVALAPGDASSRIADPRLPAAARERWRRDFGLDRPLPARYLGWLAATLRGDLDVSWQHRRPVAGLLAEALPPTVLLTSLGLLVETLGGLAIAVVQAMRPRSRLDRWLGAASLLGYAAPPFAVGLGLVWLFSYALGWLPPSHMLSPAGQGGWAHGRDLAAHLVLPVATIGLTGMGALARYTRGSLVEERSQGYVLAALARGCSRRRALLAHALPNAALPLVTVLGLSLPFLVSGSLLVEVVFAWPGMGQLLFQAALARDIPLLMAGTLVGTAAVVLGNVLADLAAWWLDPRVRP
ncbi:MAG TPA: ABC transporter permease [Thermoanaerobaculaceae bacterium]|nr:ABC transporter permease [Thermoanaerobaculaceae bacterium]HRS17385.1 ABC transporter permease [Thermoanaerobaculaceae bacterium]